MVDSLIGTTIGKYQIVERIGQGAMAEVYKAYQSALDRHVAVKLLHSFLVEDEDFLDRFQREARAAAHLRHPNIVRVFDFDVVGGVYYYMVMEFIDGHTLRNELEEMAAASEIMPLDEAIHIVGEVASALSYAHERGVVHRDIKPSNVMINREGHVILTDFGMARMMDDAQYTMAGTITGTPNYISPEQGLGKLADTRSDLYALGVMFFQMVTGRLPYEADSAVAVLLKHVNDPIPIASQINPVLPPDIDNVTLKVLAKDPDERYQTADEFIGHLKQVEAGESLPAVAPSTLPVAATGDSAEWAVPPFSAIPSPSPSPVAALSDTVGLTPYILSSGHIAADPADLPAVCDADWDRAVGHFVKGYITDWLREVTSHLRAVHQHGLADEIELIAVRADAIIRRVQDGDDVARNVGLEEFLELLGATSPVMDITPGRLDLPAVGVGETGKSVALTVTNSGRGYLSGSVVCRVPWLTAMPKRFGCRAGERCRIMVRPSLDGLPASRIQLPDGLQVRSTSGDQDLEVQVDILPSVLQVDVSTLDFGVLGQGEIAQTTLTLRNSGRGYLIGRVRCRVPWLTALPEQFRVSTGDSVQITVSADSRSLPPGDVTHAWALMIESNGGQAVMGMQMQVLPSRLKVEPAQIDLGVIDLVQLGAGRNVELTVRNAGHGVLTGAVTAKGDWLAVDPVAFRCRAGEAQCLRLSTTRLKTGNLRQIIHVVSDAGVVDVPVLLQVDFSLEPEMVRIPAEKFLRGSRGRDKRALSPEKPQHQIYLTEYWIGKYPVTNAQYAVFVEDTASRPLEHWERGHPPQGKENHPVVNVSWRDAVAYCHWLAEITGKLYRLPTEAQWEKAARGAEGQVYPWGNRWNKRKCNTKAGARRGTTPVGVYSPAGDSPYGCADMAGNVWEWMFDWYRKDYYARSSVFENPRGPSSGAVKVLRGGSWSDDALAARSANRAYGNRELTSPEVGFRCALVQKTTRSSASS